jgi:hypothetical protein
MPYLGFTSQEKKWRLTTYHFLRDGKPLALYLHHF